MCGYVIRYSPQLSAQPEHAALASSSHRGPDDEGEFLSSDGHCWMGHRRLSILDLSAAGHQPMSTPDGRYTIVFNGEIYNYLELRLQLGTDIQYQTGTDTEVLLVAYEKWGEKCLDHLIGMFSFAIWDAQKKKLFVARDRFGVKPCFYSTTRDGELVVASEIKSIHEAGVRKEPNRRAWANYLAAGLYDHTEETFWSDVYSLPAGHMMEIEAGREPVIKRWYDLAGRVLKVGIDQRDEREVAEELRVLLEESVMLRFRSDVPVGVCLSGGLDSSLLLGLIHRLQGQDSVVQTFTFYCNDERYDETPWVQKMLENTNHPASFCLLKADEVPELADAVQRSQDEPFGGLPTLGMAKVHQAAREQGVTVLLDGNGMDEGWAGYEYYGRAAQVDPRKGPVQGSKSKAVREDCLNPDFAALAQPPVFEHPFMDPVLNLQYRDLTYAKIPRAMRFADRVSMMLSRELREPFLDHRLLELGFRQPENRRIRNGQGKYLPRQIAGNMLPGGVREAPKRPVQTPQREWLAGELSDWVSECIEAALSGWGAEWLDAARVRSAWGEFQNVGADNSFPVWQWISLGLCSCR